jgi:hypothetical protein
LRKTVFFTAGLLLFLGWNIFAQPGWDLGGPDATPPPEESGTPPPWVYGDENDPAGDELAVEPEPAAEPEPVIAVEPEPATEEPPARIYGDENDPAGDELAVEPEPAAEPAAEPEPVIAVEPEPGLAAASPARPKYPFVFSEGAAASWLTRIIKQTGRSNFVFGDFLPGLYFSTKIARAGLFTPMIRVAAYYPLQSTFNKMPQPPKVPLHYAADLFIAPNFELNMFKYARINLAPGPHLFFLNSERWNYLNLGLAGLAGVELPLTKGWTILINGMVSLDNGNLGANRDMEPFDIVYQYQVDFGVRYSKKAPNEFSYIRPRPRP